MNQFSATTPTIPNPSAVTRSCHPWALWSRHGASQWWVKLKSILEADLTKAKTKILQANMVKSETIKYGIRWLADWLSDEWLEFGGQGVWLQSKFQLRATDHDPIELFGSKAFFPHGTRLSLHDLNHIYSIFPDLDDLDSWWRFGKCQRESTQQPQGALRSRAGDLADTVQLSVTPVVLLAAALGMPHGHT